MVERGEGFEPSFPAAIAGVISHSGFRSEVRTSISLVVNVY
jgi:hypothetical protein